MGDCFFIESRGGKFERVVAEDRVVGFVVSGCYWRERQLSTRSAPEGRVSAQLSMVDVLTPLESVTDEYVNPIDADAFEGCWDLAVNWLLQPMRLIVHGQIVGPVDPQASGHGLAFVRTGGATREFEMLWYDQVGEEPDLCKVVNIPFKAEDLALGDVVRVVHRRGERYIEQVVERSGHQVTRVMATNVEVVSDIAAMLTEEGFLFEQGRNSTFAIDVPDAEAQSRLTSALNHRSGIKIVDSAT